MQTLKRIGAGLAVLGVALLVAGSCQSRTQTNTFTMDVTAVAVDSMAKITVTWKPGADDGFGPLDGYRVKAYGGLPLDTDSLTTDKSARSATVTLGPYAPGSTQTGEGCVQSLRRRQNSSYECKPWSLTFGTAAPRVAFLDSVRVAVQHDTIVPTMYYRPPASDGQGPVTLAVVAGDNQSRDRDSTMVPGAAGQVSFFLTGYQYEDSVTGYACVTTARGGQSSESTCKAWSAYVADQPPPPPVVDTVTADSIVAIRVMPDSVKLTSASTTCLAASPRTTADGYPVAACRTGDGTAMVQQFCAMFLKTDGKYYLEASNATLPVCREQYDLLPAAQRLPNYPVALGPTYPVGRDEAVIVTVPPPDVHQISLMGYTVGLEPGEWGPQIFVRKGD